ncbi:MAG: hybrid sensor histidine kinase/response regulator [Pseudomonadota bacterium]
MNPQDTSFTPDIDPAEARKYDVMFSHVWFTGLFSIAAMLVCALLMAKTEQFEAMLIWVSINCVFVAARWLIVFKPFTKLSQPTKRDYTRNYYFLLGSWFTSGVIWGTGAYLFLPPASQPALFVSFMTIYVGVTTGNLPNFSSSTIAGVLFIYPSILGLTLRVWEYGYGFLVVIALVYIVYITAVLMRLTRVIGRAISLDVQNEALLKQVTIEKENVEIISQEKTRFLAAASHDLRQPLNSLGLFLYSLRQKFTSTDRDKDEDLRGAENAFKALRDLFASLLEISRFEDGAISAELKQIELNEILQPIIEELSPAASAKDLTIVYQPRSETIVSDPALLSRILRNLLDNAIKFTQYGSITIEQKLVEGQLCVSVEDTGIGIPENELSNIFDEYHQIANKRRNRREGIGLGLSIVKKMSELLNHPITVESELGRGSRFTIKLPISSNEVTTNQTSDQFLSPLYGVNALLIDDELDVLMGMTAVMESWGCETVHAETLEQAIEQFGQSEPDIILCDFRLHQSRNGLQVVEHLREQFDSNIPAIIISGDRSEELKSALAETDLGLLSKPVNPAELHAMILSYLD